MAVVDGGTGIAELLVVQAWRDYVNRHPDCENPVHEAFAAGWEYASAAARPALGAQTDDIWARPGPQPGDVALAEWLHDKFCVDDSCEGWPRVGSFGKRGWLNSARETIAYVAALLDVTVEVP